MDIEIAYQEALDYLYSFIDYSLTRQFRYSPEKFDLSRMKELLDRLGNPERAYPIIHIAGTKGKGSVSAFCASALRAAGYRTGLYTSPHLEDYTERIQINGENIPHAELVDLIGILKPQVDQIQGLTTFEITTALAYLYFARQNVNAAVIEVGLGGRLDATNVAESQVSVITALSYDHMNVLGDTLAKIAGEKAGIIKPGKPVVSAPQKEEARKVIEETAAERGSRLIQVGKDYLFAPWSHSLDEQTILIWSAQDQPMIDQFLENNATLGCNPYCMSIPLLGYHQVENAATAYAALQTAREAGFQITEEHIRGGFSKVVWPGRFELLRKTPPMIIDSAHNPDSALKLRLALDDYLPGMPVIMIFGASEDKDVRGIFTELLPRVQKVIATQSVHPRAMETEKIVSMVHQFGCPAQSVIPLEAALERALELAGNEAAVIATGSIFIAAGVRHAWFEKRVREGSIYER
ncbi:MAG: bifunctional folylpolyglutamate synthase/dihydrofolate synthase [Chloroflexi bacterium]|nr:bifunctional folylpolyglutamate synthase/dihydrofolate synthase [Chloroflexota bacterium]